MMITERGQESSFVSDDAGTTNTLLAAALSAVGIPFHRTRASAIVTGDGIRGNHRITWYFEARSLCGKYSTKELIAAWDDRDWHQRNPEHPFAYIKCASQNHQRLIDHLKQDTPLGLVRKGDKVALVSMNASQHVQDVIFSKL
jgi:hypothetical protein